MARARNFGRRCVFEPLENRRLLAGDVTAQIISGNLLIKGDDLANGIAIAAGTTAGTVAVTGVTAGGAATSVNGSANAVTLSGFTGKLSIKMEDGNDTVTITGITTAGKAKIKGGDGDDTFNINGATFNSKLTTKLGKGDDTLSIDETTVTGKTKVSGRDGNDDTTIADSTFTKLRVSLGKDSDSLTVSDTTVSVKTSFNGRRGTNTYIDGGDNSLAGLKIRHFNQTTSTTLDDVSLNSVSAIAEGGTATLTGTFTDSDTATAHSLVVDWGDANSSVDSTFAIPAATSLTTGQNITSSTDSTVLTVTAVSAGKVTYSIQHRYLDDGLAPGNATSSDTSTITVTVTAGNSFNESDTTTVVVNDATPSVTLNAVSAVSENGLATLTGSYTDTGLLDAQSLSINWGDPNNTTASNFAIAAVRNAAGTATLTVGQQITSSTDSTVLTISSVNTTTGQVGFSAQHRYLDDGAATGNSTASDTSSISVGITDDDAKSGASTTSITVNNVTPTLSLNAVSNIAVNGTATLTGAYTDIGLLDQHPLLVEWGDNTSSQFLIEAIRTPTGTTTNIIVGDTFTASSGGAVLTITSVDSITGQVGFSVSHQYTTAGTGISITTTLLDDDTGSVSESRTLDVSNA